MQNEFTPNKTESTDLSNILNQNFYQIWLETTSGKELLRALPGKVDEITEEIKRLEYLPHPEVVQIDSIRGHRIAKLFENFKSIGDFYKIDIDFNELHKFPNIAYRLAIHFAIDNLAIVLSGAQRSIDPIYSEYMGINQKDWKEYIIADIQYMFSFLMLKPENTIVIGSLPDNICNFCTIKLDEADGHAPHCVGGFESDSTVVNFLNTELKKREIYWNLKGENEGYSIEKITDLIQKKIDLNVQYSEIDLLSTIIFIRLLENNPEEIEAFTKDLTQMLSTSLNEQYQLLSRYVPSFYKQAQNIINDQRYADMYIGNPLADYVVESEKFEQLYKRHTIKEGLFKGKRLFIPTKENSENTTTSELSNIKVYISLIRNLDYLKVIYSRTRIEQ